MKNSNKILHYLLQKKDWVKASELSTYLSISQRVCMLGIELTAPHMLGKHSATELHSQLGTVSFQS